MVMMILCEEIGMCINSSSLSAAYVRQWTGPSLVQEMAWRLFGAKPLPEPMLVYCPLDSWEKVSMTFESVFYTFYSRKCIWKCRLPKWRPFCPWGRWVKVSCCVTCTVPSSVWCSLCIYSWTTHGCNYSGICHHNWSVTNKNHQLSYQECDLRRNVWHQTCGRQLNLSCSHYFSLMNCGCQPVDLSFFTVAVMTPRWCDVKCWHSLQAHTTTLREMVLDLAFGLTFMTYYSWGNTWYCMWEDARYSRQGLEIKAGLENTGRWYIAW